MPIVHWIETEISRHYEDLDLSRGVDLDRDGDIEGPERTDRDGDGEVDSAEWQKFMGDNKAALEKLGGHFKMYYSAGTAFKPDNPIHDLLVIEADLASSEDVGKAYGRLEEILRTVKGRVEGREIIPEDKLWIAYVWMEDAGVELKKHDDSSFIASINEGAVDCDLSSSVVLAVAHELNWPVYLVRVPGHAFVRWDDGKGNEFNMDQGSTHDDEYYLNEFHISQDAIRQGVYMRNMGYSDVLSLFYCNRGMRKIKLGRDEDAIGDCSKAIELDPSNASAYIARGYAKLRLERHEDAIEDFDRAIELDPFDCSAYSNRGFARQELGRLEEAIEDYDGAIGLDPNCATASHNRKAAEKALSSSAKAIREPEKALEIDPPPSCLCDAPGQGPASDQSLLSILFMLMFD